MSKVDKGDYLDLYEYMEGLADTLDNLAESLENKFYEAASISLNLSSAIAAAGESVREAENQVRRAL